MCTLHSYMHVHKTPTYIHKYKTYIHLYVPLHVKMVPVLLVVTQKMEQKHIMVFTILIMDYFYFLV